MKKFFSFFFGSVLFVLVFFHAPIPVYALRLMPTVIEYTVLPGATQSHTIALYNDSQQEISVVPTVYAVDSTNLYGFPHLAPLDPQGKHSRWISLPKDESVIQLKPRETRKVEVTVSLPKSVQPGGYYFSLVWGLAKGENEVMLSENPGINIAISVPGSVIQHGSISFFGFANNSTFGAIPIHFIAHITNDGGRHFKPYGRIDIKNMFGISVDHDMLTSVPSQAVSDQSSMGSKARLEHVNVLPGGTREFYATWKPAFALGLYTAVLSVDAEDAGKFSATRSFIVFPALFFTLWGGVLSIVLAMGTYFLRRSFKYVSSMKD